MDKLFEMYELEAYMGDYADDFDVEAIIDEATYVDANGNRRWRADVTIDEIVAKYDKKA